MSGKSLFTIRTELPASAAAAAVIAVTAASAASGAISYSPASGASFNEGSSVTISASLNFLNGSSASGSLVLDGNTVKTFSNMNFTTQSHSQVFADEGTHTWTAAGSVHAEGGGNQPFSETRSFTINNVAPTLTSFPGDGTVDVALNPIWSFSAMATDPGVLDVLSFFWDLNGDGIYEYTGASGVFDLNTIVGLHDGAHTVRVLVSDGDGGVDQEMITLNLTNTPAPGSAGLLGLGGLALARRRRRR